MKRGMMEERKNKIFENLFRSVWWALIIFFVLMFFWIFSIITDFREGFNFKTIFFTDLKVLTDYFFKNIGIIILFFFIYFSSITYLFVYFSKKNPVILALQKKYDQRMAALEEEHREQMNLLIAREILAAEREQKVQIYLNDKKNAERKISELETVRIALWDKIHHARKVLEEEENVKYAIKILTRDQKIRKTKKDFKRKPALKSPQKPSD